VALLLSPRLFLHIKLNDLKCPECRHRLERKTTEVVGSVHGKEVAVNTEALVCVNCGFKTVRTEHMGEFALRVADAYRVQHGLLTSSEIRDRRLNLGMSQQQFANYLGVGVASVKRWELGQVQDEAMNTLMVLKTDPKSALDNAIQVAARAGEPCWFPLEWPSFTSVSARAFRAHSCLYSEFGQLWPGTPQYPVWKEQDKERVIESTFVA
jgi:putative zinc finger/helix-turn-helix YgiT family protein